MPLPRLAPLRSCRGFTLIELMLGLGIVAVLVALALPAYTGWRTKALSRKAGQEIAAMSVSIKLQWQDAHAYPADLAATGFASQRDPWGRPYVYYNVEANGRGGARKDRALNPINSDFDLYSMGPDGVTQTQVTNRDSLDDIIRANNGAFIDTAANF